MRLRFQVSASVFSSNALGNKTNGMCQYPNSVIKRVIVCNRDGCSYQSFADVKDGQFDVDFELQPQEPGAALCDTLKFHFYSNHAIPVVIAAGAVPMADVGAVMAHLGSKNFTFACNFAPINVSLTLKPVGQPTCLQLDGLDKSTLCNTADYMRLTQLTCTEVGSILTNNLVIKPEDGAPMFCNLMTAHNFQGEATTHIHYQSDIEPTPQDGRLFYASGITMTALAYALQAKCATVDEVLAMDQSSPNFTAFVTEVCQAFIRSAHLNPYVSDEVLSTNLDAAGRVCKTLSECFKLPFREPFLFNTVGAGYLHADDCEGHATFIHYLFNSFKHMYRDAPPLQTVCPDHIFGHWDAQAKISLQKLANFIGQKAHDGSLRTDILLISAGSAALGDGGNQLGGHATIVLVNSTNKDEPHDMLMEGTNSMTWDDDKRTIVCMKGQLIPVQIPLVSCANLLTQNIANLCGEVQDSDRRMMAHLNSDLESKFYKVAFCQNGQLLATPTQSPSRLNFGVNMQRLSDYKQKVFMPITSQLITKITKDPKADQFMARHREQRKLEIHPPRTDLCNVQKAVAHWSPLELYQHDEDLKGRQYKVCLAMRSIRDADERAANFLETKNRLQEWNSKFREVGVCSAFVAFDTVFTRLCMFTDNLPALQRVLSAALTQADQPCSDKS